MRFNFTTSCRHNRSEVAANLATLEKAQQISSNTHIALCAISHTLHLPDVHSYCSCICKVEKKTACEKFTIIYEEKCKTERTQEEDELVKDILKLKTTED